MATKGFGVEVMTKTNL